MTDRQIILVIDPDPSLFRWIQRLPLQDRIDVHLAHDGETGLQAAKSLKPHIVFIAVDLPEKEGFALFTRLKKIARRTRTALVTASVAPADMKLHEKLKVHAEAYLDRRTFTGDELLRELNELSGLDLTESELAELAAGAGFAAIESDRSRTVAPGDDPWMEPPFPSGSGSESEQATFPPVETLDAEAEAALAALGESLDPAGGNAAPEGSTTAIADLERELKHVRSELDQARRAARSSPFSSEFLGLSDVIGEKDREIDRLGEALASRDEALRGAKSKLGEFAKRLVEALKERDESLQALGGLRGKLAVAEEEASRLKNEYHGLRETHEAALKDAAVLLQQEKQLHQETRQRFEIALPKLKAREEDNRKRMEEVHVAAIATLERQLDEKAQSLALAVRHQTKLEEEGRRNHETLAALEAEHEAKLAALRRSYEEALAGKNVEAGEALRRESEMREAALAKADERRRGEIAQSESRRRSDLAQAESRYRQESEGLEKKYAVQMERLKQQAENLKRASAHEAQEATRALEEERRRHAETRGRLEAEISELETRRARARELSEQELRQAVGSLSERLEREKAQAIEADRVQWKRRLEEMRRGQENDLAGLRADQQKKLADLKAEHEQALARRGTEAYEGERRARAAAERELAERLDRAREEHARAMKALTAEHERQIATLQVQHRKELERNEEVLGRLNRSLEVVERHGTAAMEKLRAEHAGALSTLRRESADRIAALEREREEGLAAAETHQVSTIPARVGLKREADQTKALAARNSQLAKELEVRQKAIADRDEVIEGQRRELSEKNETIGSLTALIQDLHRSIQEHLRDQADQAETINSLKEIIEAYTRERLDQDGTINSLKSVIRDMAQEPPAPEPLHSAGRKAE